MLSFETKNNRPHLIIFVHGFTGGKDTWVRTDGQKSILDFLKADTAISDKFDFAIFDYFTKVTDVFATVKSVFGMFGGNTKKMLSNIPVEDISNELQTEIRYNCTKYKHIVLIAHSLGGLVSKSYILDEITANKQNKELPVKLFISLAVPHRGTNLAVYAKAIVGSPQVSDLQPLSDKVNDMNDLWNESKDKLPETAYFWGSYDKVVPKKSAVSIDAREKEILYLQDDHTSINTPKSSDAVILTAITAKCLGLVNKSNNQTVITTTTNVESIQQPITNTILTTNINASIQTLNTQKSKIQSIDTLNLINQTEALIQNAKELINADKLEDAARILKGFVSSINNDLERSIINFSANLATLAKQQEEESLTQESYRVERNRIRLRMINFMSSIPEEIRLQKIIENLEKP